MIHYAILFAVYFGMKMESSTTDRKHSGIYAAFESLSASKKLESLMMKWSDEFLSSGIDDSHEFFEQKYAEWVAEKIEEIQESILEKTDASGDDGDDNGYYILYLNEDKMPFWEYVSGEDAMQQRVSELADSGYDPDDDISVLPADAEII